MSVATSLVTALEDDTTVASNFNLISHAWNDEPEEIEATSVPTLLVWPGPQLGAEGEHDEFVSNMVSEQYNVLIVCKHEDLTDRLADYRSVVEGWQYPTNTAYDLMEYLTGDTVRIKGDIIWWLEVWHCRVAMRSVTT